MAGTPLLSFASTHAGAEAGWCRGAAARVRHPNPAAEVYLAHPFRPAASPSFRLQHSALGHERATEYGHPRAKAVAWHALWTSRLVVLAAGVLAVLSFGRAPGSSGFDPAGLTAPFGYFGNLLAAPFARWDSVWYLAIAQGGYAHEAARTAFFPLYPLVLRGPGLVIGSDLVAGVLVSLVAFGIALALLYRLVALELSDELARATVMLIAFSPDGLLLLRRLQRVAVPGPLAWLHPRRSQRALGAGRDPRRARGGVAQQRDHVDRSRGPAVPVRPARRPPPADHPVGLAPGSAPPPADPGARMVAAHSRRTRRLHRLPRAQHRPRAGPVPRPGGLVPPLRRSLRRSLDGHGGGLGRACAS